MWEEGLEAKVDLLLVHWQNTTENWKETINKQAAISRYEYLIPVFNNQRGPEGCPTDGWASTDIVIGKRTCAELLKQHQTDISLVMWLAGSWQPSEISFLIYFNYLEQQGATTEPSFGIEISSIESFF